MRFVTQKVHAYIDYPVAFALLLLPFVFGLGTSHIMAKWLSVGTGAAALILTILTNHELGMIKVIPYSFHVLVDRLVGFIFLVAPFAFGFTGIDAIFYWVNAAAVLSVTLLFDART